MNKKEKKIIETLKMSDNDIDNEINIQGTPYDRKCKYSESTLKKMHTMYKKHKTFKEIASELGLNVTGVRYRLDPEFKATYNASRSGKHTGKNHITVANRIAYKRELVASGCII